MTVDDLDNQYGMDLYGGTTPTSILQSNGESLVFIEMDKETDGPRTGMDLLLWNVFLRASAENKLEVN